MPLIILSPSRVETTLYILRIRKFSPRPFVLCEKYLPLEHIIWFYQISLLLCVLFESVSEETRLPKPDLRRTPTPAVASQSSSVQSLRPYSPRSQVHRNKCDPENMIPGEFSLLSCKSHTSAFLMNKKKKLRVEEWDLSVLL